eukprot:jgi/Chrzof1/10064/Cz04g25250.t1
MDYETTTAAVEGVISMFEKRYCELNPRLKLLQYDIQDLYKYIDSMVEMACLVWEPSIEAYRPCNKDWIKHRIQLHFQEHHRNGAHGSRSRA